MQRKDDYDIVYSTLRRTCTVTLSGNSDMATAVHFDGKNLILMYVQPNTK